METAEPCNPCRPGIDGLGRLSGVRTHRYAVARLQHAAAPAPHRPQQLIQPPETFLQKSRTQLLSIPDHPCKTAVRLERFARVPSPICPEGFSMSGSGSRVSTGETCRQERDLGIVPAVLALSADTGQGRVAVGSPCSTFPRQDHGRRILDGVMLSIPARMPPDLADQRWIQQRERYWRAHSC